MDLNNVALTEEWLRERGFKEMISFEIQISKDKFLSISRNDLDKWYVMFRNKNKGKMDELVCLRDDLRYTIQLDCLYYSITDKYLHQLSPSPQP